MLKFHDFACFARAMLLSMMAASVMAQQPSPTPTPSRPSLANEISSKDVPRLTEAPKVSDFEGRAPATELARKMLMVEGFLQRDPKDGSPVSERTQAFLGYT
ncbi:MAG: hypothetical protein ACHP79_15060, partial [Terriglobales bacterium]